MSFLTSWLMSKLTLMPKYRLMFLDETNLNIQISKYYFWRENSNTFWVDKVECTPIPLMPLRNGLLFSISIVELSISGQFHQQIGYPPAGHLMGPENLT